MDGTSSLWLSGQLANKAVTGFTGSMDPHGGQESTLLALHHTMFHWGSVIVPPGWVDYDVAHAAGGVQPVDTYLRQGLPGFRMAVPQGGVDVSARQPHFSDELRQRPRGQLATTGVLDLGLQSVDILQLIQILSHSLAHIKRRGSARRSGQRIQPLLDRIGNRTLNTFVDMYTCMAHQRQLLKEDDGLSMGITVTEDKGYAVVNSVAYYDN